MESDWTARVDQATAGTIHDQLRTVIGEARDVLEKFQNASWDQGGLVLDAQRQFEASFNEKLSKVSADVEAAMAAFREEMAKVVRSEPASAAAPDGVENLRSEVFSSLAAFGEELDAETKRIHEAITTRMNEMSGAIGAMNETHARLEERMEVMTSATDERFAAIMARFDGLAAMEERSTARMVEIFATAFMRMRDEQHVPGFTVAG